MSPFQNARRCSLDAVLLLLSHVRSDQHEAEGMGPAKRMGTTNNAKSKVSSWKRVFKTIAIQNFAFICLWSFMKTELEWQLLKICSGVLSSHGKTISLERGSSEAVPGRWRRGRRIPVLDAGHSRSSFHSQMCHEGDYSKLYRVGIIIL